MSQRQSTCPTCGSMEVVEVIGVDSVPPQAKVRQCRVCGDRIMPPEVRQKLEERVYVDRLLAHEALLDVQFVEANRERPDFLLQIRGRKVGIELTAIVRAGQEAMSLKARDKFRRQVAARARRLHKEQGRPNLGVGIGWLPVSAPKSDVGILATSLADFVAESAPEPSNRNPFDYRFLDTLPPSLQDHIGFLTIIASGRRTQDYWRSAGFATYPEVDEAEIAGIVTMKERKAAGFPRRWDELWLLIYATGLGEAEYLTLAADRRVAIQTTFDRVFFLDAESQLTEITSR